MYQVPSVTTIFRPSPQVHALFGSGLLCGLVGLWLPWRATQQFDPILGQWITVPLRGTMLWGGWFLALGITSALVAWLIAFRRPAWTVRILWGILGFASLLPPLSLIARITSYVVFARPILLGAGAGIVICVAIYRLARSASAEGSIT